MTDFVNPHLAQAHSNLDDLSNLVDAFFDNGILEDALMPIERADVDYEQAQARIATLEAQNAALLAACEAALPALKMAFFAVDDPVMDRAIEQVVTASAAAKEAE